MHDGPQLSVLIPVFNERATLAEIIRRVQAVPIPQEIIVVDNLSTDGTRQDLEAWLAAGIAEAAAGQGPLRVVFQEANCGKGSSVRRALELARGEYVIVQDADLEYDPSDYGALLATAEKFQGRVAVFGSRLRRGTTARRSQPHTAFFFGRIFLAMLFRVLYGVPVSDVATCYKLMRRDLALSLQLRAHGFDLDFEIAARLCRGGHRIVEVPVSYSPRTEIEGKKIHAFRDGWRAAWTLLRWRLL